MRHGAPSTLLLAALALAPGLTAQTSRSPFLPPSSAEAPAPTENAPLQFCGYLGTGENTRYCIHNPSTRRSVWLRAGEETAGVRVESFDPETRTVMVAQGGTSMRLKLQAPNATAAGGGAAPAGPLPVAGQTQPNNALINTVVANPTPADEAKRLEAVAAEVRRRRALRQAAAAQQQQQQQAQRGAGANPR